MNMYDYTFTYMDNLGNELKQSVLPCFSKKESLTIAAKLLAESNINDLYKINTRKK